MPARDDILARIRRTLPEATELPALNDAWSTYPDPRRTFAEVLSGVGGQCRFVADAAEANACLGSLPEYTAARKTCSLVPGIGRTNFDLAAVSDPHELEDVDFAVLPGRLAVAENAAVWVTDEHVRHRVLYFLTQHLALVVPAANLVHNLHEAYQRIDVGTTPFAAFVSGPSKTADIEQALVIGAHGARSLTVLFVESQNS